MIFQCFKVLGNAHPPLCTMVLLCLVTGCASTNSDLYYWGEYEDVLHTHFTEPGKMTAHQQVEVLEQDIAQAEQNGLKVAPGVHAQLGVALAELGNRRAAQSAFSREVALYPEAAPLLDGMMKRADNALKVHQGGER